MPIQSSFVTSFSPQIDGRIWVSERHLDQLGVDHGRFYLASVGLTPSQASASCAAIDAAITDQMTQNEVATNILAISTLGKLATITFNESTVAQNAAAVRAAYATMTQNQAVFTGEFLGSLTDIQLQTAFGLTSGQVTTLRANFLTQATNAAASIRASVGT